MNKSTLIIIVIFLLCFFIGFYIVFIGDTIKANNELKNRNWELELEIRDCQSKLYECQNYGD